MGNDKDAKVPQDSSCTVNLLKVRKQVVFVHDPETKSFSGIIKGENHSCRFVTFLVRSSNRKKFKIKPRYGIIRPGQSLEICVTTRDVQQFHEISQDFFGVFALPVYDKRQLEKRKLSVLWRALGSDLLPFTAAEFHKVPFIVPKTDEYFDDLSIAGRINEMAYVVRRRSCEPSTVVNEDKPVDDETFLLNWPTEGPISEDSSLEPILKDWHRVSKKIQTQTRAIQQSYHIIVGTFITAGTTLLAMSYLYLTDAVPFVVADAQKSMPVAEVPVPAPSSWFSWLGF